MERSTTWTVLTCLAGVFLVVLGVFLVGVGGADDSPGLGGLGMITAVIGGTMVVKRFRFPGR